MNLYDFILRLWEMGKTIFLIVVGFVFGWALCSLQGCTRYKPVKTERPVVYDYPNRAPSVHEKSTVEMYRRTGNEKGLKRFLRERK